MSYTYLTVLLFSLHTLMAVWSVKHALLNKRDPRAALGWIIVSIFFTIGGPLLYWIFGINRVQKRAQRLLDKSLSKTSTLEREGSFPPAVDSSRTDHQSIQPFLKVSDKVCRLPVIEGNKVVILLNGDEAYPQMLQAIADATQSVHLMTYIFDTDDTGHAFIDALDRAQQKGIEVKVLIDGVGE
ncbi:MAG: PLDc N-terminal domain-containing protein, partial [Gammaproteobacteria bacterium]